MSLLSSILSEWMRRMTGAKLIFLHQVIGGELQDRLIPVPYSKNTTDQAVSRD